MAKNDILVWIDLEMTGLDLPTDTILEISSVVTDNNLEIIAKGPTLVIHHDVSVLERMNEWNQKHHGASGLIEAVKLSQVTMQQAQEATLNFLKQYTQVGQSPLCGNSVWVDRAFLRAYMPQIDLFLHYRIIDVSSIKEVVKRWYKNNSKSFFKKSETHRAQEDILASIDELKHYRDNFFIPSQYQINNP